MELSQSIGSTKSKFIARVYLYVALGLLMTALVAFSVGAIVAKGLIGDNAENVSESYGYLIVGSGIALLIDAIVMRVVLLKNNRSGWVPYIIYCALFGVFLSTFVVMGIPFRIFGEAFGISALVFLVLFLIGYYSPVNLNIIASIGLSILLGLMFFGLFFVIFNVISPSEAINVDLVFSGIIFLMMLIVIAADAYNIKKYAEAGSDNDNLVLWCASTLYTDFIYIFIRIMIFLLKVAAKNK